MGIETIILLVLAVLLAAVAIRVAIYSVKYIYIVAPSVLAWILIIALMHMGGAFEIKKGWEVKHDASSIGSVENKSIRDGSTEQRNDVKILPKNAPRRKGRKARKMLHRNSIGRTGLQQAYHKNHN